MKNSTYIVYFLLLFLLITVGCGGATKTSEKKAVITNPNMPSISFEEMKEIYEGCDFIDIIFYTVDFSMSVNAKSNIQRMVGMVSTNAATLNPECQAMGRLFFQKNGEMLIEADMYFDDKCQYFVFQKDGQPVYANYITPEGQAYFKQVFAQVKVTPTAPPQ
ncbi:MAG: hypothetical protein AAGJ18_09205 [Bacteroidota bacterium]